jgi:type IV secretory pathway VirB2 component (pilin)
MKKIVLALLTLVLGSAITTGTVSAGLFDGSKTQVCQGLAADETTPTNPDGHVECDPNAGNDISDILRMVISILSFVAGVVSVIMIIIAGFKYITSSGDSSNVQSAKNTLIYAVVGIVIAILAQVIVRFVVNSADNDNTPTEELTPAP